MDGAHHLGEPVMDILLPTAGQGPGVLVLHPWWGLNQTIRDYGAALAHEGFAVGLADLFEGKTATTPAGAQALIEAEWFTALERIALALNELTKHEAVASRKAGAVGFSFGGFHLLRLLGANDKIGAAAIYYATFPDANLSAVPVMAHFAEHDEFETDNDRGALLAKLPASRGFIYPGTAHWFAEADRPEYRAEAARLAFERTVAFLREAVA
jgi:carboxymethylenebutenolidase